MYQVKTEAVDFTIKRLPGLIDVVGGGIGALPNTVFMSKQKKSIKWWGIHVESFHRRDWDELDYAAVKAAIVDCVNQMGHELMTDVTRLIRTLNDIVVKRKKPVIYGAGDQDLLQAQFDRGCQIDVYRDPLAICKVKDYGGYQGVVTVFGAPRAFMLYHRGVALYNYLNESEAAIVIERYLTQLFPEVFVQPVELAVHHRLERLRGKSS